MTQKELYNNRTERDKIIELLFVEHGLSPSTIHSMTYKDIIQYGFDSDQSDNKVFNISLRQIQSITKQFTQHQTFTTYEDIGYKRKYKSLDDELEELLKEPDTNKFLQSCGYLERQIPLNNFDKKATGFKQEDKGVLYITNFYNSDISFLKFGVTNDPDITTRTKTQVYHAKRQGIKYDYEHIYSSSILDGDTLYNAEQQIRVQTNIYDRIPKSLLPDGHTETCPIECLGLILSLAEDLLGENQIIN